MDGSNACFMIVIGWVLALFGGVLCVMGLLGSAACIINPATALAASPVLLMGALCCGVGLLLRRFGNRVLDEIVTIQILEERIHN